MSNRYGKWPHEFLELNGFQQGLALLCARAHDADSAELFQRARVAGTLTPVVVL